MNKVLSAILLLVGLIHILPITGAFGMQQLSNLYALDKLSASAELLMRHRAILLSLIGLTLIMSAFFQALQVSALILAMISVSSFLLLWFLMEAPNAKLSVVAIVDAFALMLLLIASGFYWRLHSTIH